ncbi:MAG: epoxyqueuosine reductase QueH [Clostridia bacterium]|nr:epoxyqueuosine reductase QueH [Clostridia bacterium]MBR6741177.1 epoxyqueuosine reductase QueH [Clostridia bacterium]
MKKVLLHCCCAPCSLSCIEPLQNENFELSLFWYNPNIHPFKEYEARRDCLLDYAKEIGLEVLAREKYGLRDFVKNVASDIDARCVYCYRHRLEETAKFAKENGFQAFTTTLLASLYQDHEAIKKAGEEFAERYGVEFLYRDFRPNFREGNSKAREKGFYMQKYCGCIFSEEDRYKKQIERDSIKFEK